MKFFFLIVLTIFLIPAYAQQNYTENFQKDILISIEILQEITTRNTENIDLTLEEIESIQNLVSENNQKTHLRLNEIIQKLDNPTDSRLDEITSKLLYLENNFVQHSQDTFDIEKFQRDLSTLQAMTAGLLSVVTMLVGIAVGTYINQRWEKKKKSNELEKAYCDIQTELERLNNDIGTSIRDCRDVLRDLHTGNIMINRMINRQITAHDELVRHVRGLHFILWNFTLPHMDGFTNHEKDQLERTRLLIGRIDGVLERHHTELLQQLETHLRSGLGNGVIFTMMRDDMIENFRNRMQLFSGAYQNLHRLNFDWLNLSNF